MEGGMRYNHYISRGKVDMLFTQLRTEHVVRPREFGLDLKVVSGKWSREAMGEEQLEQKLRTIEEWIYALMSARIRSRRQCTLNVSNRRRNPATSRREASTGRPLMSHQTPSVAVSSRFRWTQA
jgi:hypothetical protein